MQKIVIFDMDGTLIDSKKDITISINHVRAQRYALKPLNEAFVVDAINKEVRNLSKLFYNTQEYMPDDRNLFEEHYAQQCTKNVVLYDGIKETLLSLKEANVKFSVATNAPTKFAQLMLSSLDVADMFDMIIGADKVSISKPSPEMLHKILNFYKYDAKHDKAWMIGDNTKDISSAKNANIEAFFATWGFSKTSDYHDIVKQPQDILTKIL